MNNKYWIAGVVVVLVIILGLVWAKRDKTVDNASTDTGNNGVVQSVDLSDGTYNVDTEASTVKWSGDYVSGGSESGVVALSSGSIGIVGSALASGELAIDLSDVGIDNFFSLETYPSTTFKINKVLPNPVAGTSTGKYIIDGWLTIKGMTNAVSFPVTVNQSGNRLTADTSFALNRADWGVTYDPTIKNAVSIELHIEATK